jgi:hypothetical protein
MVHADAAARWSVVAALAKPSRVGESPGRQVGAKDGAIGPMDGFGVSCPLRGTRLSTTGRQRD